MDLEMIIKFSAALLLVLAMMGGLALILKTVGGMRHMPMGKERRLKVVEVLQLDHKRKVVMLQRDDKQHLLLLGANSEAVIETNIKPVKEKDEK